jgi:aldose sugar dehydrogenase
VKKEVLVTVTQPQITPTPVQTSVSTAQGNLSDSSFEVQTISEGLETPWAIDFLPTGEILFTERTGKVSMIQSDGSNKRTIAQVAVLSDKLERGLLGLAVDPNYTTNKYVYIQYTTSNENRISRYTYDGNSLTNEKVIFQGIPAASLHDGGRLRFGPDGKLYATTGDANNPNAAQDKSSKSGKYLRINTDGSIPTDNPFGNAVWSYGHRNPQGITWHPNTGVMFGAEH